ncbi:MAG: tRNA-modifying protein YgfZ [Alphaproteobacteria bacterium MarineAlpha5_Bin11]|nr:MAG: tRNA-modifying protein YgfZ [Alphaproteobacteria bacterium MarineAlpha5_Bin11]|tara:strand:- start:7329 stop:8198 length:870 start_codon:yes stop_codon:yes gene_type:complete
MTTNKYAELNDSSYFEIGGSERNSFLQGLITNDINKCTENKSIYSAFLSPQGKFIADFFIINSGKTLIFETHKKFTDELIKKMNFYKLRSDVYINKINSYRSIVIYEQNKIFDKLILAGDLQKIDWGFVFLDPRNSNMGLKASVKIDMYKIFCDHYKLKKYDMNDYEKKRIECNIPDSALDLKVNKSLLLENNYDSLNAIDWDKGCYIGQELTARMKYRALIKKSLIKVKIVDGFVKPDDEVYYNDIRIGNITSVNKDIGLAMLKLEYVQNTKSLVKIFKTTSGKIKVY